MALRIGLPRALLYHKYSTLWEAFLSRLGAEVVVSAPTNKVILNSGVQAAEAELCLPVRLFHGHAIDLRGKVDAIFVPRVISVEKNSFTCPKFFGLPDLLRAMDEDLPPLLTPTFNARLGRRQFYRNLCEFGQSLSAGAVRTVLSWWAAERTHRRAHSGTGLKEQPGAEADCAEGSRSGARLVRLGVAGHPYNLNDRYISMDLLGLLRRNGAIPLVREMLPDAVVAEAASTLPRELYWTYEKEIVGAIFHWARTRQVDGIIYVRSFSCGPDSIVQTLVEYEMKKIGRIGLLPIVLDEHSAEAGLVTRVEAFLDMLQRRKAA